MFRDWDSVIPLRADIQSILYLPWKLAFLSRKYLLRLQGLPVKYTVRNFELCYVWIVIIIIIIIIIIVVFFELSGAWFHLYREGLLRVEKRGGVWDVWTRSEGLLLYVTVQRSQVKVIFVIRIKSEGKGSPPLRACTGTDGIRRYDSYPFATRYWHELGGQHHAPMLCLRERPSAYCTGGWMVLGLVWTGAGNPARTGIRSPNRPARR